MAGRQLPTQVGRALEELGIETIVARSPQAKGRIERTWRTFQDRLSRELRLAGAATLDEANAVLRNFLAEYNVRFARTDTRRGTAYRKLDSRLDLNYIFSLAEGKINPSRLTPTQGVPPSEPDLAHLALTHYTETGLGEGYGSAGMQPERRPSGLDGAGSLNAPASQMQSGHECVKSQGSGD